MVPQPFRPQYKPRAIAKSFVPGCRYKFWDISYLKQYNTLIFIALQTRNLKAKNSVNLPG